MTEPKSSRLGLYWSMMRYGLSHNRDFAREHYAFFQDMLERLAALSADPRARRVLDIGCGKTFWLTLLLHSLGARVTGFDTDPPSPRTGPADLWNILKTQGPERALRTAVWALVFARPYYRELARQAPFTLNFNGLDLRTMKAERLDFDDDTFDLAVSHEVFEHLPDLPGALDELGRVLKPGGLTFIYIHNYAGLSGGHHIAWKYPDTEPSTVVPPWDHLRENRFPDIPSWINRVREAKYRSLFSERFDVLQWAPVGREGEALLTPEIRRELHDYTEDELLTKGFTVIARPKKRS